MRDWESPGDFGAAFGADLLIFGQIGPPFARVRLIRTAPEFRLA